MPSQVANYKVKDIQNSIDIFCGLIIDCASIYRCVIIVIQNAEKKEILDKKILPGMDDDLILPDVFSMVLQASEYSVPENI